MSGTRRSRSSSRIASGTHGPETQRQLLVGHGADVGAVEMVEPVLVEDGAAMVDLADVEPRGKLVEGEDLLLGAGRPAEEGKEVDEAPRAGSPPRGRR